MPLELKQLKPSVTPHLRASKQHLFDFHDKTAKFESRDFVSDQNVSKREKPCVNSADLRSEIALMCYYCIIIT